MREICTVHRKDGLQQSMRKHGDRLQSYLAEEKGKKSLYNDVLYIMKMIKLKISTPVYFTDLSVILENGEQRCWNFVGVLCESSESLPNHILANLCDMWSAATLFRMPKFIVTPPLLSSNVCFDMYRRLATGKLPIHTRCTEATFPAGLARVARPFSAASPDCTRTDQLHSSVGPA